MNNYRVFTRTWWRENPEYPDGLEPHAGKKTTIGYASTEEEAREIAQEYNQSHEAGRLSSKAEYSKE